MPKRYVGYKSIRKYIPALPPTEVAGKVAGGMGLYRGLKDSLSYLHAQNANLSSQFITQRGDIRRGGQETTQSAAGSATERGVLGSSNDIIGRQQIRADVASQLQGARTALKIGQMGNASQMMQARRDFDTGMMNLAMMADASRQNEAIARMLDGRTNAGGGRGRNRNGSGGGSNNNGSPNFDGRIKNKSQGIRDLLSQLKDLNNTSPSTPSGGENKQRQIKSVKADLWRLFNQRNNLRQKDDRRELRDRWLRRRIRRTNGGTPGGGGGHSPGSPTGPQK